jgi:hypothetical protein
MSEKDFVVTATSNVPTGRQALIKPCYMVKFSDTETERFVALDVPKFESSHIEVKGFLTEASEESVIKDYVSLHEAIDKSKIRIIYYPWCRVHSVSGLPKYSK